MTMSDDQEIRRSDQRPATIWMAAAAVLLGLGGLGYGFYSHGQANQILESQRLEQQEISQMQEQMQTLRSRLMAQEERERELALALAAAEKAAAERKPAAAAQQAASPSRPAQPKAAPARAAQDPRVSQLEKKVAEQDEKLANTQRLVESARTDLEGRIDSTSQELNGSIARTGEEVAQLRRRGERDYFEFDIRKSKQVQRVGPVGVALRKADTKRKRYNLDMMVDDNKLEKKNVNLFEPVYITSPEWPQPLELVVNQVTKDRVAGYISVPKYKRSELAQSGVERSRLEPRETDPPLPE